MATQEFKTQNGVSTSSSNPYLIDEWAGPEVVYIHPNYSSDVDVISSNTQITRDENGAIYNPETEGSWDENVSPGNTLWNADGWEDLYNVTSREYVTFYQVNDENNLGSQISGAEYIMKDTDTDKYYTVKFTSWQNNSEGGAFSYVRREINTAVFFKKNDYESIVDVISPNIDDNLVVAITRDENGGIYNPYVEESYNDNISPGNTLWNADGWDDLSNIKSRAYLNWYSMCKSNVGQIINGQKFVMKDTVNNEYWTVEFHQWSVNSSGGGFSYTRRKINAANPPMGLKFNDGSIQTSAVTDARLGSVPRSESYDSTQDYYLTERDIGKFVIFNQTCSVYIPDAKSCQLPLGTVFTLINMSGGEVSVYKDNDNEQGIIYNGAGSGSSDNGWGLNSQGIFTLIKFRQYYDGQPYTDWMIAGPDLDNYC